MSGNVFTIVNLKTRTKIKHPSVSYLKNAARDSVLMDLFATFAHSLHQNSERQCIRCKLLEHACASPVFLTWSTGVVRSVMLIAMPPENVLDDS